MTKQKPSPAKTKKVPNTVIIGSVRPGDTFPIKSVNLPKKGGR